MAHPQIAIFARLADGSAQPVRKIEGQKSLLGRTMHAISYDAIHDEFTVPQELGQAILTFRGGANGEEPPIRIIQGPLTQLRAPDRLEVDAVHNEIYVPAEDKVLVFPRDANGNVAPIRVIEGPNTQLGAAAIAADPVHNLLVVGGSRRGVGTRLLVFNRTDDGNVKPKTVIGGPKNGPGTIQGPFAIYPPKNEIIMGTRTRGGGDLGEMSSEECYVGVWSTEDNGDVPPHYRIGGPHGIFRMVRGVVLDPKNKSVIASDKRLNAVMTFYAPELF